MRYLVGVGEFFVKKAPIAPDLTSLAAPTCPRLYCAVTRRARSLPRDSVLRSIHAGLLRGPVSPGFDELGQPFLAFLTSLRHDPYGLVDLGNVVGQASIRRAPKVGQLLSHFQETKPAALTV